MLWDVHALEGFFAEGFLEYLSQTDVPIEVVLQQISKMSQKKW